LEQNIHGDEKMKKALTRIADAEDKNIIIDSK